VAAQEQLDEERDGASGKKDRYKSLMMVVRGHGYPFEKHYITTEDNYINCVFRISGPRGTTAEQNAK